MILYVKECSSLSINTIIPWIKNTISIVPFSSFDMIKNDDIIIISKTDLDFEISTLKYSYHLIVYEDFFEKISTNVIQATHANYDFYYLNRALIDAENHTTNTLISGSSYGLFGVNPGSIPHAVNLSLSSQDLYYSLKGIYQACNKNDMIKNIVLCVGYYYFFTDLSKNQNPTELERVSRIYQPIFHDAHNCFLVQPYTSILNESKLFDLDKLLNLYVEEEYQKGYFRSDRPRPFFATKTWNDTSKSWIQLSCTEKHEAAKSRTNLHNKLLRRENTFLENLVLFQNFISFCNAKNINVLLSVAPNSSYYHEYLSKEHITLFYEFINSIDGTFHLLDLSDNQNYCDEDFIDSDHLSDSGAIKYTQDLLNTIEQITKDVEIS